MKKIQFICDKCKKVIAKQLICLGELQERHLIAVGDREWCVECVIETCPEVRGWPNKAEYED